MTAGTFLQFELLRIWSWNQLPDHSRDHSRSYASALVELWNRAIRISASGYRLSNKSKRLASRRPGGTPRTAGQLVAHPWHHL